MTGALLATAEESAVLRKELERLTREHRHALRDLEHLRAAARTAIQDLDTTVLAQAIARQAALQASAERASVGVIEYDAILVQAHHGSAGYHYPNQLRAQPGAGLAPRVVASAQTALCPDARTDPHLGPEFAAAHGVRNGICVPVVNHQSTVIAFVEVANRKGGGRFTQEDVRALENLALMASLGFQRSRLLDRLAEWSRSLEMLLAFNAAVNKHLKPTELVRQLVENAVSFLKADGGMAGLAVPMAGGMAMVADGILHRGRWHELSRRWRGNEGLAGRVLESEFPLLLNNYPEERQADPDLVRDFDVRQALCVPIKDQNEAVIGFFELHRSTSHTPFTWQDAAFLESLANVTAVAIWNAQLAITLESKNQEIQSLSAHHVNRLEEERRHISRELHDEAGQILIGIKLALQVLARKKEHGALRGDLDDLREQVNQATGRLKDLARWLRPPTLDQLGLEVALRQLATDMEARSGLAIELDLQPVSPRLPQAAEIALYRIAQEALTNALRHSGATSTRITLGGDAARIALSIRDNGQGFDETQVSNGLGLLGMKERAGMLNGELRLTSTPGAGTEIYVEVPR